MPRAKEKNEAKSKGKPDFAKSYRELEEIVTWFEGENMDLDEALDKFEKGMKLAEYCRDSLKKAENRITKIKSEFYGESEL